MGVSFEISLEDAVTGPANDMAASLGSVEDQSKTLESAMASLEKQMTKASALGDTAKVSELQGKYEAFGGALEKLGPQAEASGGGMDMLGEALEGVADPMVLAGAALALAAGLAVLTIKGAELALEMGELREKTLATFSALGGGKAAGEATIKMLDDMRASTGMTRAELTPLATKLMAMGVQGAALESQLKALASVKAIGVDGGEEEYLNILKKISGQSKISSKDLANLAKTGVNVDEMAKQMGISVKALQAGLKNGSIDAKAFGTALQGAVTAKGADALATQAASLTNQLAIAKESFTQLFEGVDVKPFTDAIKPILAIFGQGTASGKAMKSGITGMFDAVFKIAAKVLPYVKHFLLDLVIAALKIYIAFKPVIAHFKSMFDTAKGGDFLTTMLDVVANTLVKVGQAAAWLIDGFLTLVGWWGKLQDAAAGAGTAFRAWVSGVVADITGLLGSGEKIASDFIDGMLGGIMKGVSKVVDAAKNLGSSALAGVKGILGIASPSKVMAKMGGHTAAGLADGMEAGTDAVASAGEGMGAAAAGGVGSVKAAAPGGGAAAGGGGGGGVTINVGGITITGAGGTAQQNLELMEQEFTLMIERVALSQGLGQAA